MNTTQQKASLESKLMVYKLCYQQAESHDDEKRMDKIMTFIDELSEKINSLD